jgi:hypothetical protein
MDYLSGSNDNNSSREFGFSQSTACAVKIRCSSWSTTMWSAPQNLDSPSRNIGGLELKKLKFSEDQIVKILAEAAKGDKTVAFF